MAKKDKKEDSGLPIDKIKELSKVLAEQGLTEIEVEIDGQKIKVRKENGTSAVAAPVTPAPASAEAPTAAAPPPSDTGLFEVKSPMVGTFYSASSPDADAFVKQGSKVKKGDTLCIVEAMKLMNELPSEVDGEVVEICVNNAEAISYGQVIMRIKL